MGTLHAGKAKKLESAAGTLTVWTGKGEFLEFNVNGKDLGRAADGVIRNIVVTKEGIKIGDKWVKRI